MEHHVQLVYFGEVLAGFDADHVKGQLGRLLKLDEPKLSALFSGQRTVLKRSLPSQDAERYTARLAQVGARIRIEPMANEAATPAAAPALPTVAPVTVAPVAEQITCPSCGERQSKRILCRACATDMPMGIAAKLEAEQEARAARLAEARARRGIRAPRERASASDDDVPSLWGWGLSGRLACLPYTSATGVVTTALLLMVWVVMKNPTGLKLVAMAVAVLAALIPLVRLSVLRLHDFNRSGWWCLLLLVPYLNFAVSLVLMFMPGSREDNDYGGDRRVGSLPLALLSSAAVLLAIGLTARTAMTMAEGGLPWQTTASEVTDASDPQIAEHLPNPQAADGFRNLYAPAPSHKAFAAADRGAWGWKSGAASPREAVVAAMRHCEDNRKPYTTECALVNVDGMWAPR